MVAFVFWDKFVNISSHQHDSNHLFMVCNYRSSCNISFLLTRFISHPITPSCNTSGCRHYSLDLLGSTYQFIWSCLVIITWPLFVLGESEKWSPHNRPSVIVAVNCSTQSPIATFPFALPLIGMPLGGHIGPFVVPLVGGKLNTDRMVPL